MHARLLLLFMLILSGYSGFSQLVINEISSNGSLVDAEGEDIDWLEIYNSGPGAISLNGYALSDDALDPTQWPLPDITLPDNGHLFIAASGNDLYANVDHWESPVLNENTRKYFIGTSEPPADWNTTDFNDAAWLSGPGGLGYGDGDDNTIIAGTISVYMRCKFTVDDLSVIENAKLHADYDDAFVAYLNGVEIARSGNIVGAPPAFNTLAGLEHEAGMYVGYPAEEWNISAAVMDALLVEGDNYLCMQVHNVTAGSSDISSNFWLSCGVNTPGTYFDPVPLWFVSPATYHETNFKISNSGETIYLFDASGSIADAVFSGPVDYGHAYARIPDGSPVWCITNEITPGYINVFATCYAGYEPDPVFSLDAGFYTGAQILYITAPSPSAQIRFTTDGSAVTETSPLYTGAILITENMVVAARCYSNDGLLPGNMVKHTYFINEDDYTLPILSISIDPGSLFDFDTGIYELGCCYDAWYPYFGANFWQPWERYGHIEYFTPEGALEWRKDMALEIHGGWSRAEAQKGFRVDFKGKYDGALDYPLFGGKPDMGPINNFNIRSGGQHVWTYKIQDSFLAKVMKDTYIDYEEWQPVMLFINGDPWGLYEIREKADEHFAESNYGFDNNQVDLLNGWSVLNGSDTGWYNLYNSLYAIDPASDAFYTKFDQNVDIQNYTDYYIGQIYYQNVDFGGYYWGVNNLKVWRYRNGGKWRFIMYDLDGAMGFFGSAPTDNYIELTRNPGTPSTYSMIFDRVLENQPYRNYFVNRFADLINTIYTPDHMESVLMEMRDSIITEIPHQLERWGAPSEATVDAYVDGVLNYNYTRKGPARTHINASFDLNGQRTITLDVEPAGAGYIKLNTIIPAELPWTGIYFDGVPVTMTAVPNPGYTFSNWEPNDLMPAGSTDAQITINLDESDPFTALFSGTPTEPDIVVSEINYNDHDDYPMGDWVELFNNGAIPVDLSYWQLRDRSDSYVYTVPFGTMLEPGAYLVMAQQPEQVQSLHPGLTNIVGGFYFEFDNAGDDIKLLDAGGTLRVSMTYADSSGWPEGADGTGRTLEIENPDADMNAFSNWFDGCIAGSPGTAYMPCADALVFGEINYNSADATDAGDWVEIWNTSGAVMDISGWMFTDDADTLAFYIPEGTELAPNERWVFVNEPDKFEARHPEVENYAAPFAFGLNAGGEELRIFDETGQLKFTMIYDNTSPWPIEADGGGKTLELVDPAGKVNAPENWFAGCPEGSPGSEFVDDCKLEVDTFPSETPFLHIFPNPATALLNLQYAQYDAAEVLICITDMMGKTIFRQLSTQSGNMVISCEQWASGVYQVSIVSERTIQVQSFVVQ